jgi:hypothetical protein
MPNSNSINHFITPTPNLITIIIRLIKDLKFNLIIYSFYQLNSIELL